VAPTPARSTARRALLSASNLVVAGHGGDLAGGARGDSRRTVRCGTGFRWPRPLGSAWLAPATLILLRHRYGNLTQPPIPGRVIARGLSVFFGRLNQRTHRRNGPTALACDQRSTGPILAIGMNSSAVAVSEPHDRNRRSGCQRGGRQRIRSPIAAVPSRQKLTP
jgi:hypothetical protein